MISLYQDEKLNLSATTSVSPLVLTGLHPNLIYVVSVQTCITHKTDCDTLASSLNRTIRLRNTLISQFRAKKIATNVRENSTGLLLEWSLSESRSLSDLCDIGFYTLVYDMKKCLVPASPGLETTCNTPDDASTTPTIGETCAELSRMLCTADAKCTLRLQRLAFNANYNVSLSLSTRNGAFKRPSVTLHARTSASVPAGKTRLEFPPPLDAITSVLNSGQIIHLLEPRVDQTNGVVLEAFLFLVRRFDTRAESHSLNHSNASGFSLDARDQLYLRNLMETASVCELNTTQSMQQPCLLKRYARRENSFLGEDRLVFVGTLKHDLSELLPNSSGVATFENVTTDVIEPDKVYQLFYAFKIGEANADANDECVYYATEVTEPILSKRVVSASIASSFAKGDGLAIWIVVVTSIMAAVLLITFIVILAIIVLTR